MGPSLTFGKNKSKAVLLACHTIENVLLDYYTLVKKKCIIRVILIPLGPLNCCTSHYALPCWDDGNS